MRLRLFPVAVFSLVCAACGEYDASFEDFLATASDKENRSGYFEFQVEFSSEFAGNDGSVIKLCPAGIGDNADDILGISSAYNPYWTERATSKTNFSQFSKDGQSYNRIESKDKAIKVPMGEYKVIVLINTTLNPPMLYHEDNFFMKPGKHYKFSCSFVP